MARNQARSRRSGHNAYIDACLFTERWNQSILNDPTYPDSFRYIIYHTVDADHRDSYNHLIRMPTTQLQTDIDTLIQRLMSVRRHSQDSHPDHQDFHPLHQLLDGIARYYNAQAYVKNFKAVRAREIAAVVSHPIPGSKAVMGVGGQGGHWNQGNRDRRVLGNDARWR
jgi:hypothetical protein